MKKVILDKLKGKKIIILGFGREGVSSYTFIRKHFPTMPLTIADKSPIINVNDLKDDLNLTIIAGESYDDNLNDYDLILKSPGVSFTHLNYFVSTEKLTSQTDLFMKAFSGQIIGVTGTKGKSTTASLIFHILKNNDLDVFLAGNIGIPFFDIVDKIKKKSVVVAELSAHQLEFIHTSPYVAILLNLYQEHLDHFISFNNYQLAKLNITCFQHENDILIYNQDDSYIPKLLASYQYQRSYLPFNTNAVVATGAYRVNSTIFLTKEGEIISEFELGELNNLPGVHNYNNIMAAILACKRYVLSDNAIYEQLKTFKGLEHRIEFVGKFNDILFYNDSISTIPEATIAAVKALKKVDTLILGGFDRGIDYTVLLDFLRDNPIANIVFIGQAGKRMFNEWKKANFPMPDNFLLENDFTEIVDFAYRFTATNKICLLSPAAASYDQFKNFEVRGRLFKDTVKKLSNPNS